MGPARRRTEDRHKHVIGRSSLPDEKEGLFMLSGELIVKGFMRDARPPLESALFVVTRHCADPRLAPYFFLVFLRSLDRTSGFGQPLIKGEIDRGAIHTWGSRGRHSGGRCLSMVNPWPGP